jgi:hypothetical protein
MSIQNITTISKLAEALYDFLPANPHPYADKGISFPGCANRVGVGNFWLGGSKRPAVTQLLQATLERNTGKFCPLLLAIVETAIPYRLQKQNPITREEVVIINRLVVELGYKIPKLWDPSFLGSLPRKQAVPEQPTTRPDLAALRQQYMELANLSPQERGYAFQHFLSELFVAFGLAPRDAFRLKGEEIDGSLVLDKDTYLIEAKWHKRLTGQGDLLIFQGKISGKAAWSRGLFISYLGFTQDGLEAFSRGKSTNMIGMDGLDLFYIVEGRLGLTEAILRKARRAAETNEFFVSLQELI